MVPPADREPPAAVDVDAVADALFAAIETGDLDAVAGLYTSDVAVWHNTDGVAEDRAANLRTLGWFVRSTRSRAYRDVRRSATADGFVQQHVLHIELADGRRAQVPACLVVTLRAGRISRIDEYLDGATVAAAFAPS